MFPRANFTSNMKDTILIAICLGECYKKWIGSKNLIFEPNFRFTNDP